MTATALVVSVLGGVFQSTPFVAARNVALALAVVFWLALAFWVNKDARRRVDDPLLVGVATLLGLVPPYAGPLVYLLFRPAEPLEEARVREVELRALEEHLGRGRPACPVCSVPVEPDFLACPVCATASPAAARLIPSWQSSSPSTVSATQET